MTENFKPDCGSYKPLKSASAVANAQCAIQKGSSFHEDSIKEAKKYLDDLEIRHLRKSSEHVGRPGRLGRYRGDDLGLDNLSRFEDGLSLCRLDGWKERLSHGPMCRCSYSAHPDDQFQDVASRHRSATDKISSFTCRSEDWNPMEPFPQVQFESSGVPFAYDVPVLHKTNSEDNQRLRSYDALLSVLSMKLETQSKIIEKLHNGLKRLEDERDTYTQFFRELRDEMISLSGQVIATQTNSSLHLELGVWKHQIVTEIHHLKANINRFHNRDKDVAAENSNRVAELRHEVSEMKKFLSDEVEAMRRETRKLLSRIGQLEVDMVGVLSENKDLHRRIQKLEKSVHSAVQSQAYLSRDLCKTQSQQTNDRTDLEQLRRSYGSLSQKLNELTLMTCVRTHGILKDVPSASSRTTDLKQKTGRKSQSTRFKMIPLDHDDVGLNVTSESSSLTSLSDTTSTNNDKLAENGRRKESSANGTRKKTKAKKKSKCIAKKGGSSESLSALLDVDTPDSLDKLAENGHGKESSANGTQKKTKAKRKSKSIAKKGGSSESLSPLLDVDTPDSLTEIKVRPTAPETDQVAGAGKNHPVERKLSKEDRITRKPSGNVEASASCSTTVTTTTTTSSSSSSSSPSSSSSTSSSSTGSSDLTASSGCANRD